MHTGVGYCTNVHAARTLGDVRDALDTVSCAVRRRVSPDEPLGIGLWLPASALDALAEQRHRHEFRDWLADRSLVPYTVNGFPYGDFHAAAVKRDVYLPDWRSPERLAYTVALGRLLADLLPSGSHATISTLPFGWRTFLSEPADLEAAATGVVDALRAFRALHDATGTFIALAIEPEPGCVVDTAAGLVRFVDGRIRSAAGSAGSHLGVCHDVCHAAVMFEEQSEVLRVYRDAGLPVVKIQVSSAPRVRIRGDAEDAERMRRLAAFQEPRYLHQTTARMSSGTVTFFDDLPEALESELDSPMEWRVHFHVPIHLAEVGHVETTQAEIVACVDALASDERPQIEVETYAWNVLPSQDRPSLDVGIAEEIAWLRSILDDRKDDR